MHEDQRRAAAGRSLLVSHASRAGISERARAAAIREDGRLDLAGAQRAGMPVDAGGARAGEAESRVSPREAHAPGRPARTLAFRVVAAPSVDDDARRLAALSAAAAAHRVRGYAARRRWSVRHAAVGVAEVRGRFRSPRALKIVQAAGWYYPDSVGGTEVYVSALTRQLRASGHDVVIAAPEPGLAAPRTYEHGGCQVFRYPIPASPSRDEAQGDVTVRGAECFHRWL